jgi:hypothetical protein
VVVIFLTRVRERLFRMLGLFLLLTFLAVLFFEVARTGTMKAPFLRKPAVSGEARPVAEEVVERGKGAGENFLENLIMRLKDYYAGNL